MTRRNPKISVRAPESLIEAADDLADEAGTSRSAVWRMAVEYALENNAAQIGQAARIDEKRRDIKSRARPVDLAEGLPGRTRDQLADRFQSGYSLQGLARKAESYVEEAEMYERELSDLYRENELVALVEREIRKALEAADLSPWWERHADPYERFQDVSDAKDRRRFALVLLQNALELDDRLDPLRSVGGERRVSESDLPPRADEQLPEKMTTADVATTARQLADEGVEPEDVETDPDEYDPFGWTDVTVANVSSDGVALASADGGRDHAPEAKTVEATDEEPSDDQPDETTDEEPKTMDHNPTPNGLDRSEIVETLADKIEMFGGDQKARTAARSSLTDSNQTDDSGIRRAVEKQDMDVDALMADAMEAAE